ncbi:MAG: hypothetical protein P1U56_19465 [Saprospiraceae bacterium]|nr:hypothetical protein [Saprospiraceae bacterium]
MKQNTEVSIVMLGATGAVGGCALQTLLKFKNISRISLLGRRPVDGISAPNVTQHIVNIFDPTTYHGKVDNHRIAICTLGVGQPSKVSDEEFIKIDKDAVLDFAKACKKGGVQHFELLSSVGISTKSSTLYLRIKAELVEELKALDFERLSIFQPSMILTPTNRYGFSQALVLATWPLINPLLLGGLKKFRGVKVEQLGAAMAKNVFIKGTGYEALTWADFVRIDHQISESDL